MRGRKPKPTRMKILTGQSPIGADENEPQPTLGAVCPDTLGERARVIWARIAPELQELGLLNVLSGEALAGYCDSYARWQHATEEIQKTGEVVKSPSGYPIQNPWRAIANKAYDQWTRLAAEFGFTPSAMVRLGTNNKKRQRDPADQFFTQGKLAKYVQPRGRQ